LARRTRLHELTEAARSVIECDFGPRAGLADVERRVGDLRDVCERVIAWSIRNRGRQPPPWQLTEAEAANLDAHPDWPSEGGAAGGERVALWTELREAVERLKRLRSLGPKSGRGSLPLARHSCDFSCVHWYGTDYHFTAAQAAIMAILWREWER